MHDGSVATLDGVVEFYSEGGRPNPSLDPEIRPRRFNMEEKRGARGVSANAERPRTRRFSLG
jgi:cytochrome c peroxidase